MEEFRVVNLGLIENHDNRFARKPRDRLFQELEKPLRVIMVVQEAKHL
ncbi:MAG: hypothetical protein M1600_09935 [Firmicutes bacterium]|nr:hypothetical protein [Bacillota bacterium]